MEPDDLVFRASHLLLPCSHRRTYQERVFRRQGLLRSSGPRLTLVATFMVISPLIGLVCGFLFMAVVLNLTRKANKQTAENYFKRLQLCSAAAYSFSHGTNDAQKTMGIIIPLLFSIGYFGAGVDPNHLPMPLWVILVAYAAIALGTLSGDGVSLRPWDIKLPSSARCTGLLQKLPVLQRLSVHPRRNPVSTTHIICSSIMGVGTTMGAST